MSWPQKRVIMIPGISNPSGMGGLRRSLTLSVAAPSCWLDILKSYVHLLLRDPPWLPPCSKFRGHSHWQFQYPLLTLCHPFPLQYCQTIWIHDPHHCLGSWPIPTYFEPDCFIPCIGFSILFLKVLKFLLHELKPPSLDLSLSFFLHGNGC